MPSHKIPSVQCNLQKNLQNIPENNWLFGQYEFNLAYCTKANCLEQPIFIMGQLYHHYQKREKYGLSQITCTLQKISNVDDKENENLSYQFCVNDIDPLNKNIKSKHKFEYHLAQKSLWHEVVIDQNNIIPHVPDCLKSKVGLEINMNINNLAFTQKQIIKDIPIQAAVFICRVTDRLPTEKMHFALSKGFPLYLTNYMNVYLLRQDEILELKLASATKSATIGDLILLKPIWNACRSNRLDYEGQIAAFKYSKYIYKARPNRSLYPAPDIQFKSRKRQRRSLSHTVATEI